MKLLLTRTVEILTLQQKQQKQHHNHQQQQFQQDAKTNEKESIPRRWTQTFIT